MFAAIMNILRWCVRLLITQRTHVSAPEKALRLLLMLPPFGLLYVLLKIRLSLIGPRRVEASTIFNRLFACHPPDIIQMYLWLFGIWEPDVTAFLRRRLREGDVFIDVGANIGYDSLLAESVVGPGGRVASIEASPRIAAALQETVDRNQAGGVVRIVNKAASSQRGSIKLYAGPLHNIGLTTTLPGRGLPLEAEVPAAPLHELLEAGEIARARLAKIDVEGAEPAVIAGMGEFLDLCPGDCEVLIEMSPNWWPDRSRSVEDALRPLLDRGFHAYSVPNNLWPWRYLWPRDVQPPRRYSGKLDQVDDRLDLVLSRIDAPEL